MEIIPLETCPGLILAGHFTIMGTRKPPSQVVLAILGCHITHWFEKFCDGWIFFADYFLGLRKIDIEK